MLCSKCGEELRDDAQVCAKCGEEVPSDITPEVTSLPIKKPVWKDWILLGIFLLVLGGGVAIGWQMLPKKHSTKKVSKFSAETEAGQGTRNPIDGAAMLWVPAGTFIMGNIEGVGDNDEHPAHQVTLTGYWIYQYDVTVAQYRAFCKDTSRKLQKFPSYYSWKGKSGWNDPELQQHPIVNVSWYDAKAYADWAGVTLPTEAQWEYAARGPRGNNYPWGGIATKDDPWNGWDWTKCANLENSDKFEKSTWPVGSFPGDVSWCGAQDMAGNVWQWCGDWYGTYATAAVTDPIGPVTGTTRAQRGGSWIGGSDWNRIAKRGNNSPVVYDIYNGFRCVSLSPGPNKYSPHH